MLKPRIEKLCSDNDLEFEILDILNTEEGKHYMHEYDISSVPVLVVIKDDNSETLFYGEDSIHELSAFLRS